MPITGLPEITVAVTPPLCLPGTTACKSRQRLVKLAVRWCLVLIGLTNETAVTIDGGADDRPDRPRQTQLGAKLRMVFLVDGQV